MSSRVSLLRFCPCDAPLSSGGSRRTRFPAFTGPIRALRLPAPARPSAHCFASRLRSGSAPVRVRKRAPAVLADTQRRAGVWIVHGWPSPLPACLTLRAKAGSPRLPDDPSRGLATLSDPGTVQTTSPMTVVPVLPRNHKNEGTDIENFEAPSRRFITCCVRFTTNVAARHATRASGWRAAPLPGGSRTRWIVTKGFRTSHPPSQVFGLAQAG